MADQPRKTTPPSRAGKGPTPGSFKPGDPRINRAGRPRAGLAFAERGRERIDPDKVLDLAEQVLADEKIPARDRLAIVMPVIDRIYVKPATTTLVGPADGDERDYGHLSLERRRALLAELEGGGAADGPEQRMTKPTLSDDESEPGSVTGKQRE